MRRRTDLAMRSAPNGLPLGTWTALDSAGYCWVRPSDGRRRTTDLALPWPYPKERAGRAAAGPAARL